MGKTGIICTIGPASNTLAVLRKLAQAGMTVARLNFSHGNRAGHARVIARIRAMNAGSSQRVKILGDLEGYRIRIGKLDQPISLKKNQTLFLSNAAAPRRDDAVPFDHQGDLTAIRKGTLIYIDDGNIALKVVTGNRSLLKTEVLVAGLLKEHKGINIPDVDLGLKGLTGKDRDNIEFCVSNRVDYIAQSFVRTREDILNFRQSVKDRVPGCKIIAKIENREGIRNIDDILAVSDGIMIARGDMGVSLPIYEIAVIQKMIIRKCNRAKKTVITATQMLESMTEHLRPTRAEVTDVANAMIDGSDFLMLSAETAAGKHPVEAAHMMRQIIDFTRAHARDIV